MKPGVVKTLPLSPTPGSSPCHNNEGPEPHTGIVEACGVLFPGGGGDTGASPRLPLGRSSTPSSAAGDTASTVATIPHPGSACR